MEPLERFEKEFSIGWQVSPDLLKQTKTPLGSPIIPVHY